MKKLFLLILLFSNISVFAQVDKEFQRLDSIALQVKGSSNPQELSQQLIANATNDREKIRLIFRWIAENIAYDTKAFHEGRTSQALTYNSEEELKRLQQEQKIKDAEKTLKKKKGVCQDYSNLFQVMCEYAGIKCEIVQGYSRQDASMIGKKSVADHAWNAVELDGRWYLVDVTWAAGYTDGAVTRYTKAYNDFYYFTSPHLFIYNHYPLDKKWLMTEVDITYDYFINQVFIYGHKLLPFFKGINPSQGTLGRKEDVEIAIALTADIKEVGLLNSTMKYLEIIPVKGGCCDKTFTIPKSLLKGKYIEIFIDNQSILRYNLK